MTRRALEGVPRALATGCRFIGLAALALLVGVAPALAAHPDASSEIENLKARIDSLEAERVTPAPALRLGAPGRGLTFGGLLEMEAFHTRREGAGETSDLTLATAELETEVRVNNHIGGHVILLWEEDETEPVEVDEAVIVLTCPTPIYGQALAFIGGRMYLPFGRFASFMVSDPLTLELGETNRTAALLALTGDLWTWKGAVFGGGAGPVAGGETIGDWATALELAPADWISFGASGISDLAQSGAGLTRDFRQDGSRVPAIAAFIALNSGQFALEGEYLSALKNFDEAVAAAGGDLTGRRPDAWNLEFAWFPDERWLLAVRAEEAGNYRQDLRRLGAAVSFGIFTNTVLAVEYLYSDSKNGDDCNGHAWTAQLALEF